MIVSVNTSVMYAPGENCWPMVGLPVPPPFAGTTVPVV